MNYYKSFGLFLKAQRKARNLTMLELTEGICTAKTLHRIEASICEPSIYLLDQLSNRLNLNLLEIYSHYQLNHGSTDTPDSLINQLIADSDMKELRRVLSQVSPGDYQNDSFFLSLYYYGQGLCSLLLEDNCDFAQHYVTKGLYYEHKSSINQYSNSGYRLLHLQANILMRRAQYQSAAHVLNQLIPALESTYIENHVSSYHLPNFINRLYQSALASQVMVSFYTCDYLKTQEIISKGISFSLKEDLMRNYPVFLEYQAKLDYLDGNDEHAFQLLTTAITLYLQQGHNGYVEELLVKAGEELPRLNLE